MTDTTTSAPLTATATAAAVELRNLARHYGEVRALDNFSLQIEPGEMVALLGPSGCGKTTALRSLAGLDDIDSGSILVDGRDVTGSPANQRDMAMVFQAYSLFPHMTVAENIAFALELRKVPKAERAERVERYLELVGLDAHGGRYAHQLSGGQQQRVALARALAVHPKVLLLDEPLSALDAKVRVQLREEIRRLQQEIGITALFVTHDQEEALAIADRVGVMSAGRIEQLGVPQEIYNRPINEFVANFIGVTNRLPATASAERADVLGLPVPLLPGSAQGDATVLVRPERVRIEPENEQTPAQRRATVMSVSFLGAHTQITAELGDGMRVLARVGANQAARFSPGDLVEVVLDDYPALAI
ncbi:ABC transporter ATP-binding protein [Gulosibacter macacae]|uniref:ABC-type quaternary amine transporter n=1 Tax=Gulosibacter macacae TaxID=2488791 RepID=A0A3P3VZU0_9MICO|nr:ABC transporter ATP-binding protein [Gulosibacter macacae]RRJ88322.1 ABC transporter ATP-binding protein [Gulosibacter macacae]